MSLSVTRKADRNFMVACLEEKLKSLGIQYSRTAPADPYRGPRCISLHISANELNVTVSFDGDSSQPDVYVLSWHIDIKSNKQLNDVTFGGHVNPFHKQKATYVARGFEDLCIQLEAGLEMAIDDTAFLKVE